MQLAEHASTPQRAGRTVILAVAAIYVGMWLGQLVHRRGHPIAPVNVGYLALGVVIAVVAWRRPRTLSAPAELLLLVGILGAAAAVIAWPH